MKVTIDWAALGEVFLVSFGAAVGVIVLFAFGVNALATSPTPTSNENAAAATPRPTTTTRPVAALCFLACALVVGYSLYLIIAK